MSYESAMEKRILKTFKSKDNLIRKQQAEIDTAIHLLDAANCPQCGDKSGAYPDPRDGSAIQCQWCYEVNELKAKHKEK